MIWLVHRASSPTCPNRCQAKRNKSLSHRNSEERTRTLKTIRAIHRSRWATWSEKTNSQMIICEARTLLRMPKIANRSLPRQRSKPSSDGPTKQTPAWRTSEPWPASCEEPTKNLTRKLTQTSNNISWTAISIKDHRRSSEEWARILRTQWPWRRREHLAKVKTRRSRPTLANRISRTSRTSQQIDKTAVARPTTSLVCKAT